MVVSCAWRRAAARRVYVNCGGMKQNFARLISGGFFLAITLLIVMGGIAYLSITGLIQAADQVSHTHEVLENLGALLSEFSDTEVGERGYVMTGNPAFLEPYNLAAVKLERHFSALRSLISDNPEQEQRLSKLVQLTGQKLDLVKQTVALRKEQGFAAAAEPARTENGKRVMDEIRMTIGEMTAAEKTLLAARDLRARTRAGIAVPLSLVGNVISVLLFVAIFCLLKKEITDRRNAQEEVHALNRSLKRHAGQLEVANKELEAFSYSVSHDLRAPLRHIGGFVDLLIKHQKEGHDEKSTRYLKFISDAAQRMGELVDDLLAFSRMGRAEMRLTEADLSAMVAEVRKELSGACRNRAIDWKIAPLPVVCGDPAMLRLVLLNLVANAIKYTGKREHAVIEIGEKSEEAEHVIFVRDNGVGFDMKYAQKLFGVFQRLHHADEFEGTGIGLANVRRIIVRHGGRTWAEGIPNQGATFYFSLPKQPNVSLINNQN